jgi:hypothetical protein
MSETLVETQPQTTRLWIATQRLSEHVCLWHTTSERYPDMDAVEPGFEGHD